jgi:ankyrin repeat protein
VVKLLLKANDIDPDIPDNAGCSPLSYTAENGHEEFEKILLKGTRVNPNSRDSLGRTPLHWAVRNGHTSIAALLMESKHCNPHVADEFGDTPLHWAAESGDTPMIEILVRNKEEVTIPGFIEGVDNWPDASSVFDPNMEGIQDRTALGLAIRGGHHASAALILRIYATKTAYSSPLGESLLDYAIESGQPYIIKLVLRIVGIDLDVGGEGEKALWRAACFGDADLVKALLDSGCVDPNARTVSPLQTPLVAAVEASHWKVVELLL